MNSCNTDRFLATTVVYGLSTLNHDFFSCVRSKVSRAASQPCVLDFDSMFKSDLHGYVLFIWSC